ncbi:phytanoyl-CoA dioxygenase family protein [Pseudohalioglobus sediminis]|uniref:Phytanoyl-CoA dioxygenase family protein n=1 Tax=Pseudohalioglobus sediminis TaxID=2606449 RepID=A0A5B0WZJ8_9GAMM|nr:phytanoyl-CoA dioxygenase family protein [Pseudohalioglobus sediminis]KAA1192514.1 phytanoyl-CoA dioxygenase family protein [Pseudohalioglobus sediminis]
MNTQQQTVDGGVCNGDAAADYRRDGHVTVRELLSPTEVAAMRDAVTAAVQRDLDAASVSPLEERDTYGKAFLKHMNLWARYEEVAEQVLSPQLGRVAADLMGVEGVRIYHDQALFKEPGGGPTPWHQDQYYWPIDTVNAITMWLPLVDLHRDMGMLQFASGSHRKGYLGHLPISDQSEEVLDNHVREQGYPIVSEPAMRAGDATFHAGWTLHAAPGNSSGLMREVMTVIWVADGCRVTEPVNPNQARDITRWMPGLRPGDAVASELNPLTYSRAKAPVARK